MLADYFHPRQRALILAIFSITIYFGELIGLVTAFISEHWSWRVAFASLGIPGFAAALLLAIGVREPERGMSEYWKKHEDHEEKEGDAKNTKKDVPAEECIADGIGAEIDAESAKQPLKSKLVDERAEDEQPNQSQLEIVWNRLLFLANLPAYLVLCVVAAIRNCGGYAVGAWLQVYLVRTFGLTPSEFSIPLMIIIPIGMSQPYSLY